MQDPEEQEQDAIEVVGVDNAVGFLKHTFTESVKRLFETHVQTLKSQRDEKRAKLQVRTIVDSHALAVGSGADMGTCGTLSGDALQGDINFQNVKDYLNMIDQRGYERSPHQLRFHDAFMRATARVIYRDDWSRRESEIKKKHNWDKTPSEILISTPRRFGKTFAIAIFVAAMSLSFGFECVIFSPARRASRKLLERIVEFIKLLDGEKNIIEYNQEQCRLTSKDGKKSLIRSFPSKVRRAPFKLSLTQTFLTLSVCAVFTGFGKHKLFSVSNPVAPEHAPPPPSPSTHTKHS